jgi:hypothetical protein
MTTLGLFWPSPALAERTPPFGAETTPSADTRAAGGEPWYWTTLFAERGSFPHGLDVATATGAMSGAVDDDDGADAPSRLSGHIELASNLHDGTHDAAEEHRTEAPGDLDPTLVSLGRYGPGNIAYRCLGRLVAATDAITELGHWQAAAVLSSAFRSLFNRADSILLLDQLSPDDVYWRAVLRYCAWGNLEAVLDEYLHHLSATDRPAGLDDTKLLAIATKAGEAITPRPSRYEAFDPLQPNRPISFTSRFALRYGNKRATSDESTRQPQIRESFNSPFWPFVLATTSIGQEGIDLHWWCHAAVHWNTPASPVDFEQREGRVHRFGGHAIRRNLAAQHGPEILEAARAGEHPWDAAYRLGVDAATDRFGDLAPYWITEGAAKIQRHVLPYPLSKDIERYQRLKDDLAVYRLTFGQPRQEDLAELLKQRGVHLDPAAIDALRLDLQPPTSLAISTQDL